MTNTKLTPGSWDFACDSYGKVRHSKKACVYTSYLDEKGIETLVTVAARIPNWTDAKVMAAAPALLAALEALREACPLGTTKAAAALDLAGAAILKARGN